MGCAVVFTVYSQCIVYSVRFEIYNTHNGKKEVNRIGVFEMARERYLLDNEESTIHANQIVPTTAKEKRANWWFHYRTKLIVGILLGAALISFIWSIVGKEKPDYTITIATAYGYPDELLNDLEVHFEQYGEDLNGDGRVHVQVQNCSFSTDGSSTYEANALQASYVRFAADASSGDSMIFIYDEVSYEYLLQDGIEDFFGPVDDTDNQYYLWGDFKSLSQFETIEYVVDGATSEKVQAVLKNLKVAVRKAEGELFEKNEELLTYRNECLEMHERMMNGTKTTE